MEILGTGGSDAEAAAEGDESVLTAEVLPSTQQSLNSSSCRESDEETDEEPGLRAAFRDRRIRPKRLTTLPLRRLILLAIGQIVLAAILMAVQKVPQPRVNSAVPGAAGAAFQVPLAVFVFMVVSVAAGYWLGLAGALRVRAGLGLPVAALATWVLADAPVSSLRLGVTSIDPHLSDAGLRWAQLGVLAAFWIWLGALAAARWRGRARREDPPEPDPDGQPWHPWIVRGALAFVLAYYALELAIWVLYAQAGQTAVGTGSLLGDLGVQAVLLPVFLVLVVLLGSTDLLEWGEIAVRSIVTGTRRKRPRWLLTVLVTLVAGATLANVIRHDHIHVLAELAVIGVPAALLALLVRLAPGYGGWSDEIRSRAVITGAVVTFVYVTILPTITSAIRAAIGWSAQLDSRFYWLLSAPVALAALTVGLFFLAQRTLGEPEQRGRGLLLVIVGALIVMAGWPSFMAAAHLPGLVPPHHFSLLSGLQATAAAGTAAWLISLIVRRRMASAAQLASVLTLLAGLQIVRWVLDLLHAISIVGSDSDYALAALFILTVFWSFGMSGNDVTGPKSNTAAYPRDGRILLLVGFTLVSNATLVYLGALRAPGNGAGPPSYLTADPVTTLGLSTLGPALVLLAFITGPARRPAGKTRESRKAGENRGAGRQQRSRLRTRGAAQAGIVGVGALATGTALVIFGSALPQLTRASAAALSAPYTVAVPGPGCDAHGALWTVTPGSPITTRCSAGGLKVAIRPGAGLEGDVKFLPPHGFGRENYRVSVTVVFSSGFNGCAGIFTRASAAGRYLSAICGDDSVNIDRLGATGVSRLYLNFSRPAARYTVTAVAQGSVQSIYVNGIRMGAVANAVFTSTEYLGLGIINNARQPETATFSHFSYTPLPA
jgi:hypothetical protein